MPEMTVFREGEWSYVGPVLVLLTGVTLVIVVALVVRWVATRWERELPPEDPEQGS